MFSPFCAHLLFTCPLLKCLFIDIWVCYGSTKNYEPPVTICRRNFSRCLTYFKPGYVTNARECVDDSRDSKYNLFEFLDEETVFGRETYKSMEV